MQDPASYNLEQVMKQHQETKGRSDGPLTRKTRRGRTPRQKPAPASAEEVQSSTLH